MPCPQMFMSSQIETRALDGNDTEAPLLAQNGVKEKNLLCVVCETKDGAPLAQMWEWGRSGFTPCFSVLGAGCVENLQQPAPALAALSMTTRCQRQYSLGFIPAAASWRSPLELLVQDTLMAKPSPEIQTHNSMEAGGQAGGRAAVAPHDQTQFLSHFISPLPVAGCCLATLHPCILAPPLLCSRAAPLQPLLCPRLGDSHAHTCSQQPASRDIISPSVPGSRWEPGR